jgi:putative transposase
VHLPRNSEAVGVDVGLSAFATLSDGSEIANPRWYRAAQAKFRRAQRRVTRRGNKKSKSRRQAILLLQKAHRHVFHQRSDFQHKLSHRLVQQFGTIAVEDLNVQGLASGRLAKSVHDVGWSAFIAKLSYKAANAGRTLLAIDPRATSQTCLCGAAVRKLLSNQEHVCRECGLMAARDVVSAQVILQRALGWSVDALTQCRNAA